MLLPHAKQAKHLNLLGVITLLALSLQGAHAASSSVNQWKGAIVYAGSQKVSSGVPVSNCHVLSNEHAVRNYQVVDVSIDGRHYAAHVISVDKKNDLSLMKLDTCPIQHYAKISDSQPVKGEKLTSIYYKSGLLFSKMIKSTGRFLGYLDITTEEDKEMLSMVIDDTQPRRGASGGGVSTEHGLVSVIFGVTDRHSIHRTFAVDYFSLTAFLKKNHIF